MAEKSFALALSTRNQQPNTQSNFHGSGWLNVAVFVGYAALVFPMVYEGMNSEYYIGMKLPYYRDTADCSSSKVEEFTGMPSSGSLLGQAALSMLPDLLSLPVALHSLSQQNSMLQDPHMPQILEFASVHSCEAAFYVTPVTHFSTLDIRVPTSLTACVPVQSPRVTLPVAAAATLLCLPCLDALRTLPLISSTTPSLRGMAQGT